MTEAYKLFWLNGLDAHHETSRLAFWKTFLANLIIYIVLSAFSLGILGYVYLAVSFIPKVAMVTRRLINTGLSQNVAQGLVGAEAVLSVVVSALTIPLLLSCSETFDLIAGLLVAFKLLLLVFCAMPSKHKSLKTK